MSDSPRWEPRAIPIAAGLVAAVLALAGVRRFRDLPLNVVVLCVAGMAGAFVAKGSAYPGRFSIHLIPVTVALTVSVAALWLPSRRRRRDSAA
jgi:CHASE2 domain-containing sensor protein